MTLDNELRVLTEDMLVIADAEKASVVAGIMGGLESEITEKTTDILLEAANFSGPSIMRTEAALGLRSEASTRYEKGLDPEMIPLALDMACSLFVEVCGGTVSVGTIDVRSDPRPQTVLELRPARVEHILGTGVPAAEIEGHPHAVGLRVTNAEDGRLTVAVPTFRADLEREIDLIEEIARVHGLERVPSTLPARRSGRGGLSADQTRLRRVEDLLIGAGLTQVITYSFADERWPERLRLAADDSRRDVVKITNPLSTDQAAMRTMLLPGLLATAERNVSVREERVHIFEVGRVFRPTRAMLATRRDASWLLSSTAPGRRTRGCARGSPSTTSWPRAWSSGFAPRSMWHWSSRPAQEPFLHPGKSAVVYDAGGQALGWLGEVHPLVLQAYDLRAPAVAAEIDVGALLQSATGILGFRDLLAYPVVEQDLAVVIDSAVSGVRRGGDACGAQVVNFSRKSPCSMSMRGSRYREGKKSLALRLSFRAAERTLSETEVNDLVRVAA